MPHPQMWSSQPPCEGCSTFSRAQVRKQSSERGSGVFNVTQSKWHSQDNRRSRILPWASGYQKLRNWLPALAIRLIIIIYYPHRSLRDLSEAGRQAHSSLSEKPAVASITTQSRVRPLWAGPGSTLDHHTTCQAFSPLCNHPMLLELLRMTHTFLPLWASACTPPTQSVEWMGGWGRECTCKSSQSLKLWPSVLSIAVIQCLYRCLITWQEEGAQSIWDSRVQLWGLVLGLIVLWLV